MPKAVDAFVQSQGEQRGIDASSGPTIFEPRLVALMDVLGFKKQIEIFGADDVGKRYTKALSNAHGAWSDIVPPFRTGSLSPIDFANVTIFSDTLVLTSRSDSDADIVRAVYAIWRLFQLLAGQGFPLRGAISYNKVSIGPFTMVSEGLIHANDLEHAQEWMGVAASCGASERIRRATATNPDLAPFIDRVLVNYDVPTKSGPIPAACINWRPNFRIDIGLQAYLAENIGLIEPKLSHTLTYLRWIRDNGFRVWFDQIPIVSVGKSPPPYAEDDL